MYNDALCQLRLLRSLARQGLSSQHLDACNIRACTSSAAASAKRHDLSQGALLGRKAPTAELHLHRKFSRVVSTPLACCRTRHSALLSLVSRRPRNRRSQSQTSLQPKTLRRIHSLSQRDRVRCMRLSLPTSSVMRLTPGYRNGFAGRRKPCRSPEYFWLKVALKSPGPEPIRAP